MSIREDWKIQDLALYCIQVTHFKHNDTDGLKVKKMEKDIHAETNKKMLKYLYKFQIKQIQSKETYQE